MTPRLLTLFAGALLLLQILTLPPVKDFERGHRQLLDFTENVKTVPGASAERFGRIYQMNGWSYGASELAIPGNERYLELLQRLLQEYKVETILDIGCGDWLYSRRVDWSPYLYVGVDVMSSFIEANQRQFGSRNVRFRLFDALEEAESIPFGLDLILMKEVIQHWSNAQIRRVLPILRRRAKYLLLVNNRSQRSPNEDIPLGGFRPLSYEMPPLSEFEPILYDRYEVKYWKGGFIDRREMVVIRGMQP